jgi:hypothetical protein
MGALALCGRLLWLAGGPAESLPVGEAMRASAGAATSIRATPSVSADRAATPRATAVSIRPSTPAQVEPAAASPLAPDEVQVCGLGIVRLADGDASPGHSLIPAEVRDLALQRLGRSMAASPDVRQRAAERLLSVRLMLDPQALAGAVEADAACRRARDLGLTQTAQFCMAEQARSQTELLAPAAGAIDELARLAVLSDDPLTVAYAFQACHPRGLSFIELSGNCQLVTAEQWARLAPDDAAPWLQLAVQAQGLGDLAARDAALDRAARAATLTGSAATLAAQVAAALPEGMPALEQTAVQAELARLDGGAEPARLDAVDPACATTASGDGAHQSLCEALARMLVERARSAAAVNAGVQLGERLGWSGARTSALLQAQRAALDATLRFTAAPQALACDSLQRRREFMLLSARLGELGAGFELLRREAAARPPAGPGE